MRGVDERGEYVASSHVLRDGNVCECRWYFACPQCGADRSSLLGEVHDFVNDCGRCRSGLTGPTGPIGSFTSVRNRRRLARREERRGRRR